MMIPFTFLVFLHLQYEYECKKFQIISQINNPNLHTLNVERDEIEAGKH
jgi:hypothetical protein